MKKFMTGVVAAMVMGVMAEITNTVTVTMFHQSYPYSGKATVEYTVGGALPANAIAEIILYTDDASATFVQSNIVAGANSYVIDFASSFGGALLLTNASFVVTIAGGLGGVQLWENGSYWAECNVGASKPEEYGYYFWWGDTVGYTNTGSGWISVKDGTSISFTSSGTAASTYGKDNSALLSAGYIDSTGNLVAAHDAATAHLGAPWRMPTDAEFSALINNCTTTWITTNGVSGYLVTGTGEYASRSIFLPAAGYGSVSYLRSPGSSVNYWSSTPTSGNSDNAWYLYFGSSSFCRGSSYRYIGRSVRPFRENSQCYTVGIVTYDPIPGTEVPVATPTITGVTAQQRYPWNGKVNISYTVTGDIAAEAKQRATLSSLKMTVIDMVANTTNIATQLSGDLSLEEGTHAIVWDMEAEGFPSPFKSSNMVFNVACEITPAMYCVIDLSGGADATSYPVTYMAEPPNGGFNVDEYKTTKLVLRRIEAGTFIMGDDQSDESHRVTLSKPFFCGLFEVTQKQYSLVVGSNPSNFSGDKLPVETVSYNAIRGTSNGAKWPSSSAVDSSSFMGKLRARTGLDFDLPTEAQWEYACRAGTTTTYSYGDSANGDYMWYDSNSSSKTHEVGTKSPNPWGLYDMHGNVWEWCLDWYASSLSGGTDPKGSSSGSLRVRRGGGWSSGAHLCTSSTRLSFDPSLEFSYRGFRLVRTLSNMDNEQTVDVLCSGESKVEYIGPTTITSVTAQQRYPWNGKVDISYTVTGIAEEVKQRALLTALKVTAIDRIANTTNTATQLSGDLSLEEGTHAIVWDMDAEGFPLPFKSSNVVFIVSCEITPAMYCVIDLSGGANATTYPITYMAEPPSGGFNVDEYKTTKLVLRRIEAGTFIMGDDQSDESHRVTLSKPFFCGLFVVTQKQYSLVVGSNPSLFSGDKLPVEKVSYNAIRGTSNGAKWPSSSAVDSSSFMGKLRARTGLDFDLPTEAQWEYACRAGTTTTYSYGDSENGNYMWYNSNSSSKTHEVGTKSPNPWGLYDMHGNVREWCLDWYASSLSGGTDPKGSSSGSKRVFRGGSWNLDAASCTSSYRSSNLPSTELSYRGFRLVRTLPNE